jgi:hypothetical protein
MTGKAFRAIVDHGHHDVPWRGELAEAIARHSRNPDYGPSFSLVDALSTAGLLETAGRTQRAPRAFRQPAASYVEQFHSTAILSGEWMPVQESAAFNRAIEEAILPYAAGDILEMIVVAHPAWGADGGELDPLAAAEPATSCRSTSNSASLDAGERPAGQAIQ